MYFKVLKLILFLYLYYGSATPLFSIKNDLFNGSKPLSL